LAMGDFHCVIALIPYSSQKHGIKFNSIGDIFICKNKEKIILVK
jgi:hypothetical protein